MSEENIAVLLSDVSRMLRRGFDERARTIGVTRPQWRLLSSLLRHEGINQGGLAEMMEVEPITLCRMVDRLQQADLIERRRDPSDRRVWRLYLTPKAHSLSRELRPLAEDFLRDAMSGLSSQQLQSLEEGLSQVRQNLSRQLPEDPEDIGSIQGAGAPVSHPSSTQTE